MIIVDDKLALDALAGRLGDQEAVATTWGFHCRLLRALQDESRWGVLTRVSNEQVRRLAAHPPEARLAVLDPREVTASAAQIALRHRLNLLASELVASAVHYGAAVHLSARNVGCRWAKRDGVGRHHPQHRVTAARAPEPVGGSLVRLWAMSSAASTRGDGQGG
ncbi:MAG: hypothetical protein ACRDWW_01785 [Acidimicrobiales bacterium]